VKEEAVNAQRQTVTAGQLTGHRSDGQVTQEERAPMRVPVDGDVERRPLASADISAR
jgi:hypothetical protein